MATDSLALRGIQDQAAIEAEARKIHKVPDPFPLTLAGLVMALGPQAINFGISIGGGEAMLIPYVASKGGVSLFWLMTLSTIFETSVVYCCLKYSLVTGRTFFTALRDIPPKGMFWPWTFAILAFIANFWPAWLGGAATAIAKLLQWPAPFVIAGFTVSTFYFWSALALILVLLVFYFSNQIYANISKIFVFVMWANIITVLIVVGVTANINDIGTVLWGYFNFGLSGYPQGITLQLAASLFQQPGGALMWVTFWALEAGWGMGRYGGKVRGVLRPPEQINNEVIRWDYDDPSEVKKMQQWVAMGKWSQIVWWSVLGAMFMTFLYGTAGYSYLYKNGIVVPQGDIPVQIALIVGGAFGPVMLSIFLIFIAVTLYDAEFAYYDTQVSRTVCEAISVTPWLRVKFTYRTFYFILLTVAVVLGFYLVTVAQPFFLWLINSYMSLFFRTSGAILVFYMCKQLPKGFENQWYTNVLLWITAIAGTIALAIWTYAYFNNL
ncbi:MAG: Nramp family divalent metal transporter [Chloroflexota bacterium]